MTLLRRVYTSEVCPIMSSDMVSHDDAQTNYVCFYSSDVYKHCRCDLLTRDNLHLSLDVHSVVVVGYWPLLNAVNRQSVKLDPPPVSSTQSQLQIGLVSQSCESVFKSDVCPIIRTHRVG